MASIKKTKSGARKAKAPAKKTSSTKTVSVSRKKAASSARKTSVKKTPAKKSPVKKASAKKASAKKSPLRKTSAKKAAAKRPTAKKAAVRKTVAKKSSAKGASVKKATKKSPVDSTAEKARLKKDKELEKARLKKDKEKARKDKERDAARLKKKKEHEKAQLKKELEKARKDKEKEKARLKKELEKARKDKERDAARFKKDKELEKARLKKELEKARKDKEKARRDRDREALRLKKDKEKERVRIRKEKELEKARLKKDKERLRKEREKEQERIRKEKEKEKERIRKEREKERIRKEKERETYRKAREAQREKVRAEKEAARRALEGRVAQQARRAQRIAGTARGASSRVYRPDAIPSQAGTRREGISSRRAGTNSETRSMVRPSTPAPLPRALPPSALDQRWILIQKRLKNRPESFQREYAESFDMSWIHHDSALEGVVYTYQELKTAVDPNIVIVPDSSLQPVCKEIRRHKRAIDWARELGNNDTPLGAEILKRLLLLLHPEEGDLKSVKYRKEIPQHRLYFHDYAPPDKIAVRIRQAFDWFHGPESTKLKDPVRVAARLHYDLLRTFPFPQDSGKVARLCMNILLMRAKLPPVILHSTERQRYYDALRGSLPTIVQMISDSMRNAMISIEKVLDEEESEPPAKN